MNKCPKCGADLKDGALYCDVCGEDIHIVPDFDVDVEHHISETKRTILEQVEKEEEDKRRQEDLKRSKRKHMQWLGVLLVVLFVVMVLLIVSTGISSKHQSSEEYQLKCAQKYYDLGEYDKSVKYYLRAFELNADNVDTLETLANIYYIQNKTDAQEEMLYRILEHSGVTEITRTKTVENLISLLTKKGKFQEIHDLLDDLKDSALTEEFQEFTAPEPAFGLEPGEYPDLQSLRILCEGQGNVYYTLDGSVPGENSNLYTVPLVLDYGETVVCACFINDYGIKSPIISGFYRIDYAED